MTSYSTIVTERLIPLLQTGAETDLIELDGEDCRALLFVLRTSVPLEPFLDLFSQLTHATILPPAPAPAPTPDQTTEAGNLVYRPPYEDQR